MTNQNDYYRLGNECLGRGDYSGARANYERAGGHRGAAWNLSQLDLLEGRLDRWPDPALVPAGENFSGVWQEATKLPGEPWDGGRVDALTIVADQGAGDMIIFLRYLPEVKERVGRLTVVCHPSLHRLVRCVECVDEVREDISADARTVTTFMQLPPLLSAPVRVPAAAGWIKVPACPATEETVQSLGDGLKVGLCWSGNPRHPTNPQRSFPKEAFYGLPVKPYNLQHGQFDSNFWSVNLMFSDFLGTAQVISQLDLVITCSTSVSVLAPALGVETWVLLDSLPYWVWGLNDATPWFPGVRLFRQERAGEWGPVLDRTLRALSTRIDGGRACGDKP